MPVSECADVFSWLSVPRTVGNKCLLSEPSSPCYFVAGTRTGTTGMENVMSQYKNIHKAPGAGYEWCAGWRDPLCQAKEGVWFQIARASQHSPLE